MAKKKGSKPGAQGSTFQVGDLVGAQVKGHRMWPAQITKLKPKIEVKFFGTEQTATAFKKIKPFTSMTECELKSDNKKFLESLEACRFAMKYQGNSIPNKVKMQPNIKTLKRGHIPPLPVPPAQGSEDDEPKSSPTSSVNDQIETPQPKINTPRRVSSRYSKSSPDKQETGCTENTPVVHPNEDIAHIKQEELFVKSTEKTIPTAFGEPTKDDDTHLSLDTKEQTNQVMKSPSISTSVENISPSGQNSSILPSNEVINNCPKVKTELCLSEPDSNKISMNSECDQSHDDHKLNAQEDFQVARDKLRKKVADKLLEKERKKTQLLDSKKQKKFEEKLQQSLDILERIIKDFDCIQPQQRPDVNSKAVTVILDKFDKNLPALLKLMDHFVHYRDSKMNDCKSYCAKIDIIVKTLSNLKKSDLITVESKKKLIGRLAELKGSDNFHRYFTNSEKLHNNISGENVVTKNAMTELVVNSA